MKACMRKKTVVVGIVAIFALFFIGSAQAAILVDDFTDSSTGATDSEGGGSATATIDDLLAESMVGDSSLVEILVTGGTGSSVIKVDDGLLKIVNDSTTASTASILWNDNLGPVDLTGGGTNTQLSIEAFNLGGLPADITMTVNGVSAASQSLAFTGVGGTQMDFAFTSFSGVDFSSVSSVKLIAETGQGSTLNFGWVSASNPIPEPATMLLFGTGLIGLAAARRKRTR